jgi:hypothetical protein
MTSRWSLAAIKRCATRQVQFLAIGSVGALAVGALAFASAGPASAQSGVFVYLSSATQFHLYTPHLQANQEIGVEPGDSYYYKWNVQDMGYWSAAGISGEGYSFQVAGSNLCVADTDPNGTTGQGGASGENHPVLQTCGANGTVWISSSGFLYDRYLLNNYGYPDALGDYNPGTNNLFALVNTNFLNSGWFVRWLF